MYQHRISISEDSRVEVTACQGDLTVAAWDNSEVLVEVDGQDVLTVEERDGVVALAANSDCKLTLPASIALSVVQVQGDLSVHGTSGTVEVATLQGNAQFKVGTGSVLLSTIQGDLAIEDWEGEISTGTAQGDARLQDIGSDADLGTVNGDLVVERIAGSLSATLVRGDAYLRQLHSPLSLGDVGADLIGRDWAAGAEVKQVGGDGSIKSLFAGPYSYHIQARGNIDVKALPGSSATVILQATGGQVRARGLVGEMLQSGQWQGVIGDGEAEILLTSTHGSVTFKAIAEGEEIGVHTVSGHKVSPPPPPIPPTPPAIPTEELAERIQQRVAERLGKIDFEGIARREAERARRQTERELAKAQRAVEKAQRRAERARKKAERRSVRWRFEWDADRSRQGTTGRGQGIGEEERMAVLKMLAEGKISAEEAETLLQSLEG